MHSYLANPTATRDALERFGLVTRHRLGQNFLVSDRVIGHILDLAELAPTDVVYEVGPGIGTLTVALLARAAAVVAVEADPRLPVVLDETCAEGRDRLAVVRGDALRVAPQELVAALADLRLAGVSAQPTMLVANLPYQVAATVLLRSFEQMVCIRRAVVMVQAEVADRIAAAPGSKVYGAYTAKLALFGRVTGRFEVAAGNFMPPPHVSSSVLRIDRSAATDPDTGALLSDAARAHVAHVIGAAFAQRRKTIANSLDANGFARDAVVAALAEADIDSRARAEALPLESFVRLARALPGQGDERMRSCGATSGDRGGAAHLCPG